MDFILEEEMIDLLTFCLQNPNSELVDAKKERFKQIGHELFDTGGVDQLGFAYSKHRCTTCRASTFYCRFTIFHGYSFGSLHLSFVSAFYAVTYNHVFFNGL